MSITRILFACLVSPSVRKTPKTGGDIDTDTMDTTIRVIEEKKRENTERERSDDIASGPLHFVMEMIQKDIDTKVRGGIALLSDSSQGTVSGKTDISSIDRSPACHFLSTAAIGFVELPSSTDAEDFIVQSSTNDYLESIRIRFCSAPTIVRAANLHGRHYFLSITQVRPSKRPRLI